MIREIQKLSKTSKYVSKLMESFVSRRKVKKNINLLVIAKENNITTF